MSSVGAVHATAGIVAPCWGGALDHPDVSPEQKMKLNDMKSLNPFDLQKHIQGKLAAIFKQVR